MRILIPNPSIGMRFSFFIPKLCGTHTFYSHSQIIFYQINMSFIHILSFSFPKPSSKHVINSLAEFYWAFLGKINVVGVFTHILGLTAQNLSGGTLLPWGHDWVLLVTPLLYPHKTLGEISWETNHQLKC